MGNSVFWNSQGGEGFLQVGFFTSVVDDLSFMISREQHPPEAGFVNPEWTETSDVQSWASLDGWREAVIQAYAIVPIVMGHPAQPTVMVGTEMSSWSTLKLRAAAEAWLTRHFSF